MSLYRIGFILTLLLQAGVSLAGTRGEFVLSQQSFVSPDYEATKSNNFSYIGGSLQAVDEDGSENLMGDFTGQFVPGHSMMSYLNVRELYWKQEDFSIGRRRLLWSLLDRDFKVGAFNPSFKWNPLMPEEQGLTGLFLSAQRENKGTPWGIRLFATPVFIPDQGAGYQIKDGEFVKSNPYFSAPPTRARVAGQEDELNYTVQKPNTNDILYNEGYAGHIYYGDQKQGVFVQSALAYKPSNQLALGFQGYLSSNNSVEISILPAFYYHTLASLDVKYSWRAFWLSASLLEDRPERASFSPEWTHQIYEPSRLQSLSVGMYQGPLEVWVGLLSVTGGGSKPVGSHADAAESFLSERFDVSESIKVSGTYKTRFEAAKKLKINSSLLRGLDANYTLWSIAAIADFGAQWSMSFEAQLLSASLDDSTGIYGAYQNNDSMKMGVSYVF